MTASVWDKEGIVDELLKLQSDGFSCGRIAGILAVKHNLNITRSSVIGKLHRMGRKSLVRPGGKNKRRKALEARAARRAPTQPKPLSPLRRAMEMAPEPLPESRPDDIARVSFADLEDHLCHWIPGDPSEGDPLHSKKYCGLPIVHGALSPLCLDHLRRAFRPIEQQPREIRRSFANDNARAPVRETEKV